MNSDESWSDSGSEKENDFQDRPLEKKTQNRPGNVKAIEDEIYKKLEKALTTGNFMYKRTSDVNDRNVYRMVSKKKYVVGETFHPVLGKEVKCILYNAGKSGSKPIAQLIVLKKGDVDNVIEWFYNHFKGESARKLDKRVKKYFVGLSRNDIQKWINANEKHSKEKPIFLIKLH